MGPPKYYYGDRHIPSVESGDYGGYEKNGAQAPPQYSQRPVSPTIVYANNEETATTGIILFVIGWFFT